MKIRVFAVLACAAVIGCGTEQAAKPDERLEQVRDLVKIKLKDPQSAQFGYIRAGKPGAYCGRVNAKNELGGYSGSQRFVAVVNLAPEINLEEPHGAYIEGGDNGRTVDGEWKEFNFARDLWTRYC